MSIFKFRFLLLVELERDVLQYYNSIMKDAFVKKGKKKKIDVLG